LYWRGGPGANSEAGRTSSSNGRVAYATSSSSDTNAGANSCRGGTDSLSARVAARSAARGSRVLNKTAPYPSSLPSRTKWTRLVHPSVLIGHVSSLSPVQHAGPHGPCARKTLVASTGPWSPLMSRAHHHGGRGEVCVWSVRSGGEMCVRFVWVGERCASGLYGGRGLPPCRGASASTTRGSAAAARATRRASGRQASAPGPPPARTPAERAGNKHPVNISSVKSTLHR
jgi:hypothetical protein